MIWNIFILLFKIFYPSFPIYFNMEHLRSTHPINQHPSYDRYAEMTQFVNNITTKSTSKNFMLNIDHVHIGYQTRGERLDLSSLLPE